MPPTIHLPLRFFAHAEGTALNREYLDLLRGICENKADDAPRLVIADWLDEHGQPERAEFIRAQIQYAVLVEELQSDEICVNPDCHCQTELEPLKTRAFDLFQSHVEEWSDFEDGEQWKTFFSDWRRGFLAYLRCDYDYFAAHESIIRERVPFEKVILLQHPILEVDRRQRLARLKGDSVWMPYSPTVAQLDPAIDDYNTPSSEILAQILANKHSGTIFDCVGYPWIGSATTAAPWLEECDFNRSVSYLAMAWNMQQPNIRDALDEARRRIMETYILPASGTRQDAGTNYASSHAALEQLRRRHADQQPFFREPE